MKKNKLLAFCFMFMIVLFTGCGKGVGASDVKSVDDLSGKRIGVQLNTTGDIYVSDYEGDEAGTIVERYNKGNDAISSLKNGKGDEEGTIVERYNKGNDAISSLKNGKVDCVVIDSEPAKAYVNANADLGILEEEFAVEEYAICISKEKQVLRDDINKALAELTSDGTIERIIDYYIEDDGPEYSYESPNDVTYENGTLVMATNAAFPPYEYYADNKIVGIDADIAKAIADKLHYELVIEDMEFDTIINSVQGGKADIGMAGMTVTEDRLKNIDFTSSYTTATQVIVVRTGNGASIASIKDSIYQNFVQDDRYMYILVGLKNTVIIAIFATLIGLLIGFLVAVIRATHDKNGTCKLLNMLCHVYLAIIRGTPAMIQILIIYYVIFASSNISKTFVAIIAFGINSGAYVAEIIRGGIMALDNGQFEGARSLGLTYYQTMIYVVLPQTFKNTLPALANEFIVLIKETSISGYIGLQDLTMGGNIIRGITYQAFFPLISVAIIYFIIVVLLSAGVNRLERRLKKNER